MRLWISASLFIVIVVGIPAHAQVTPGKEGTREGKLPDEDAWTDAVVRDQSGVLRHVRYLDHLLNAGKLRVSEPRPRRLADAYLRQNAAALSLPEDWLVLDDFLPADLSNAPTRLQFVETKPLGDAVVVSYLQTHRGLDIWEAAIAVTIVNKQSPYISTVSSSVRPNVKLKELHDDFQFPTKRPTSEELAKALGVEQEQLRINSSRLMIYQFKENQRTLPQPGGDEEGLSVLNSIVPELPLPPVAESIQEDEYRVVNQVLFTLPARTIGDVNWNVFIDVKTGSVLYLRPGVAFATARVFPSDPITSSGDGTKTPLAAISDLNLLRSSPIALQGLAPPVGDIQQLTSSSNAYVHLAEKSDPRVTIPEKPSPFEFHDSVESDDFAAVSAYYHCDAAFRLVQSLGIDVGELFDRTIFPVAVDHRAIGDRTNAIVTVNPEWNGSVSFYFGRAAAGSNIGISADRRIVLHEFCHAILWNSIHTGVLKFAESGGDSLAAIVNDPNSNAPRNLTFPWLPSFADRRHDRAVSDGWGWGGPFDQGHLNYQSEQILSSTLFRMYRAIGGDDPDNCVKTFGSRYGANLIVRGLGLLNPYTPADRAEIFESAMIAADKSTALIDGIPGGAVHKVIRWSFAKQGLHRPPGQPTDTEGSQPPVDVYIDDGRNGDYLPYLVDSTQTADIWNRVSADGGCIHQSALRFQRNYLYVRVRNRGDQVASGVSVRMYHRVAGADLVWPQGMQPTTTAVLPSAGAPEINIPPNGEVVVGPFSWLPTAGEDQILASVSASGDMSNIAPASVLPVNAGPTSLGRLVPFDNNIAQRGVHPVSCCEFISHTGRSEPECTNSMSHTVTDAYGAEAGCFQVD